MHRQRARWGGLAAGVLAAAAVLVGLAPSAGAVTANRAPAADGIRSASVPAGWIGPLEITNNATGRCLDGQAQTIGSNGTKVQLWDCYGAGQTNQLWYLVPAEGSPVPHLFQIRNVASRRCLDANAGFGGANGTPVQLWDCLGTGFLNQYWTVDDDGSANLTVSNLKYSPRVLDAKAELLGGNGTPIQLWDSYGAGQVNQRWRLNVRF